jgi:hypothetical protein
MNKTIILGTIALLLILIAFPVVCSLARGTYHIGVTWGSTYGQEDDDEEDEHFDVCYDVEGMFETASGWASNNFYGSLTYDSNVYACSDAIRTSNDFDYLATFHVGHMFPDMVEYGHWEIVGYDPEYGFPIFEWVKDGEVRHYAYFGSYGSYNGIRDEPLYWHAGTKHYFSMIWTCTNGDWFYDTSTLPMQLLTHTGTTNLSMALEE